MMFETPMSTNSHSLKLSSNSSMDLEKFKALPHAITLLGMSGVGKTVFSSELRRSGGWYHYSADYRIGTRYLAEHILDNIKFKIMAMRDQFVANLLRSDSIYFNHNISVENLEPVSTFLGMFGDTGLGGLNKSTFMERQGLYRQAEIDSMIDVSRFIKKAWQIYGCECFVNDASGSLCEIVDISDSSDPVINALHAETLILYVQPDADYEEALIKRAKAHPKPMFYNPTFIEPCLADQPDDGVGINPIEFAKPLFPELLKFRKPRYEQITEDYGFTIEAQALFDAAEGEGTISSADSFLEKLYTLTLEQAGRSEVAADNLASYIQACEKRRHNRAD